MQAALESLLTLMKQHKITAADIEKLVVRTPEDERQIVNDSKIPEMGQTDQGVRRSDELMRRLVGVHSREQWLDKSREYFWAISCAAP